MTNNERLRDSSVMMSSATPSEKILLLRVAAQICEWEHGDGWFVRQGQASRAMDQRSLNRFRIIDKLGLTTNASTGRAMFFRSSRPSSSNSRASRPCT